MMEKIKGIESKGSAGILLVFVLAIILSCQTSAHSVPSISKEGKIAAIQKSLPVPFKCQGPPGDVGKSKNCGQTSALMVMSYHKQRTPSVENIMEIDDWLFQKYRDPINNYNGSGTDTRKLEALVKEYGGFPLSYKGHDWNLVDLRNHIDKGLPVIAAVKARHLSNRGYKYAWDHFLVVIGYTAESIICHDPARPNGAQKHYDNEEFSKAFSSHGGDVVVVVPNGNESR